MCACKYGRFVGGTCCCCDITLCGEGGVVSPVLMGMLFWGGGLLRQGVQQKPSFSNFKMQEFPSVDVARKYLRDHSMEHIWDLAVELRREKGFKQSSL